MQTTKTGLTPILIVILVAATLAGLFAAYRRFHVEQSNRRVEIALEWQEVVALSQAGHVSVPDLLDRLKLASVTTIVVSEDTITTLEQNGAIRPTHATSSDVPSSGDSGITIVAVDSRADLDRIGNALELRGLPHTVTSGLPPAGTRTVFYYAAQPHEDPRTGRPTPGIRPVQIPTSADYAGLRTMGLGLPLDVADTIRNARLVTAGRIGNFPGITPAAARKALEQLGSDGGASTVIFNGEEVLGWRGLEHDIASLFTVGSMTPNSITPDQQTRHSGIPEYGAVEFGKQKGDEKLSTLLKGEYIRVHSIQAAEMGQLSEEEAVDRFVRAAKERNIRFCYVRLLTFAGDDPVGANMRFLTKITHGMAAGNALTGGGLQFGAAHRFRDTDITEHLGWIFGLIALGTAAGAVWMFYSIAPLARSHQILMLIVLGALCVGATLLLQETGRKLIAFLAGIVFPTVACLRTYPGRKAPGVSAAGGALIAAQPLSPSASLIAAFRGLAIASLITALGIVQVVGLLATRPFMMRANQFLGIKAQHAVPLLIVLFIALAGGVIDGETWDRLLARAKTKLGEAMSEPARFGTLALGIIGILALVLVVARTGNDAGVGVSGTELTLRAYMDRILPVRPRTKEFLVGHPAFVLALAWWWRGRRRLAVPAFVVGSLGQVSLLNTFCHIHTPLVISIWRDGLGLFFGSIIGATVFLIVEAVIAMARNRSTLPAGEAASSPSRPVEQGRPV